MPKKYASKLPFATGSFYNNSNDLLADAENNAMLIITMFSKNKLHHSLQVPPNSFKNLMYNSDGDPIDVVCTMAVVCIIPFCFFRRDANFIFLFTSCVFFQV